MAPPAAPRSSDAPSSSTSEKKNKRGWRKRGGAKIAEYDAVLSLRSRQGQSSTPETGAGASPSHLGKRKRQSAPAGAGKQQRSKSGEGGAEGRGSAQSPGYSKPPAASKPPARSKPPLLHCSKAPRKTSQVTISAMGTQLHVIVTNEASVVDTWIRDHARQGAALRIPPSVTAAQGPHASAPQEAPSFLLGMDAEWKPTYKKGQESPVALLQLSTATHCLLVQMLFLDRTPASLRELLRAEDVVLGGVGVKQDALKVEEHHGLASRPEGLLEIVDLARLAGLAAASPSLKSFCQAVLGEPLEKSKKVTMSNWAAFKLTDRQVQYGALDAWVSFEIVRRLMHGLPSAEEEGA